MSKLEDHLFDQISPDQPDDVRNRAAEAFYVGFDLGNNYALREELRQTDKEFVKHFALWARSIWGDTTDNHPSYTEYSRILKEHDPYSSYWENIRQEIPNLTVEETRRERR